MNNRDHYIKCLKNEVPIFVRLFKALPADKLDYRPHPRSMSAKDLVWLLAGELKDAAVIVQKHEVSFSMPPAPASLAELIAAYEKNAAALKRKVAKLDGAAWAKTAKLLMEGKVAWEAPLGDMLWGFLFDAIHHRGQLSTYIRPMGGKVPSIYGPSADDPGH